MDFRFDILKKTYLASNRNSHSRFFTSTEPKRRRGDRKPSVYDGHGSVRALTDPTTGVVTDTYDYNALGNLITWVISAAY